MSDGLASVEQKPAIVSAAEHSLKTLAVILKETGIDFARHPIEEVTLDTLAAVTAAALFGPLTQIGLSPELTTVAAPMVARLPFQAIQDALAIRRGERQAPEGVDGWIRRTEVVVGKSMLKMGVAEIAAHKLNFHAPEFITDQPVGTQAIETVAGGGIFKWLGDALKRGILHKTSATLEAASKTMWDARDASHKVGAGFQTAADKVAGGLDKAANTVHAKASNVKP